MYVPKGYKNNMELALQTMWVINDCINLAYFTMCQNDSIEAGNENYFFASSSVLGYHDAEKFW